jgi:hypothetical protein
MRRVFGPRTVVEAAFLVAVPVAAAALGAGMWPIIAASAVAYLLIFVLEATLWHEGGPAPGRSRLRITPHTVTVRRPESPPSQEADPALVLTASDADVEPDVVPEPLTAPEPLAVPEPAASAEPSFTAATPSEHVRLLLPEPAQEPVPAPVAERAPLTAVPELEPVPMVAPEPPAPELAAPESWPEPSTVVPIGVGSGPRRWNLWVLERLTREHAGGDLAQDEERQFLLMYLREFADPSGLLPVDFDGLVRDSFGELVGS